MDSFENNMLVYINEQLIAELDSAKELSDYQEAYGNGISFAIKLIEKELNDVMKMQSMRFRDTFLPKP